MRISSYTVYLRDPSTCDTKLDKNFQQNISIIVIKMRYGIVFFGFGVFTLYKAYVYPLLIIPLFWISVNSFIVSLFYFRVLKNPFFKKQSGVIPLWSKMINLPLLLYTSLIWHLYRLIIKEPQTSKISNYLDIGRRLLPNEVNQSYDYYVDLTAEFDAPTNIREQKSYFTFPILDAGIPDLKSLKSLLKKLEGKKVFLHCAQGHGRTGLVAIAILLKKGKINDIEEGLSLLQSFRPKLNLNKHQLDFLKSNKQNLI